MDTQNIVLLKRHSWDNSFNSFEVENQGRCFIDFKHDRYFQLQTIKIRVLIKPIRVWYYSYNFVILCIFLHVKSSVWFLQQDNSFKSLISKFIFVFTNFATHFSNVVQTSHKSVVTSWNYFWSFSTIRHFQN